MPSARQGTIRLFRFAGIDLFLHWSWFLVAALEIQNRRGRYSSVAWNVAEYLALFLIVMLHEFGHALACRQVGGTANQIVLWPLGGVAYVNPPERPGATLWSIAAGPLVNVALFPVFLVAVYLSRSLGWATSMPDAYRLLRSLLYIDVGLLIFNMLPVYPLDGGQILRSLLWFLLGRARSLLVATVLGFCGRGRVHCSCLLYTFRVDRCHCRLHADELLGRPAARAGPVAGCEVAAPGRFCLSELPNRAASWRILEVWALRPGIRHVSSGGRLSELLDAVCRYQVPGLRTTPSHERVERCRYRAAMRVSFLLLYNFPE